MEPIDDFSWNSEVLDGTYQRFGLEFGGSRWNLLKILEFGGSGWNLSKILEFRVPDGTYQKYWNLEFYFVYRIRVFGMVSVRTFGRIISVGIFGRINLGLLFERTSKVIIFLFSLVGIVHFGKILNCRMLDEIWSDLSRSVPKKSATDFIGDLHRNACHLSTN
ncbi:hypothetical protein RhiirC2_871218 [Rhizophagus irregularis]|uniref:Uncharacterized protein n=1 Tax=Rhizophagus irregularis TaxID=588596 RepID=A0A2N1MDH1_9GLOM|nr:hypothetical protein RhiirC2_871218 [Rhizophagus irregularis]